jgi:phospholipase/carboxylesterase
MIPSARSVTIGGLRVRILDGDDGGPLVVLLHGFGAPGDDLVALAPILDAPPGTRFAFPEAPLELGPPLGLGDSRAWWLIDMAELEESLASGEPRDLSERVPDGMVEARAKVIDMLDGLQKELGVQGERTVLGGFSQGAMLSCDVALHSDGALAGLVLMSGNLLCRSEWVPRMPARKDVPVFQSHGGDDPLLSFAGATRLRDELTAAGLSVQWVQFRGGHEIPPQVVDGVSEFLRSVFNGR